MTNTLDLSPPQDRTLATVMDAACNTFPRHYRPDGCIAAARILIDVFGQLHVHCRPLAVTVDVFNPAMIARSATENGRLPDTTDEYRRWIEDSGCWWLTLGAGGKPEPGKWPGHVAVVVWDKVLVDLTLPQATRPQRGIVLAPAAVRVWREFLDGSCQRVVEMNGCELHYQARLEDRSFMRSPDWQDRRRHRDTVRAILERVRQDMEGRGQRPQQRQRR